MIPIGPDDLESTGPKSDRHALLGFLRQWCDEHREEIFAEVAADMERDIFGAGAGRPMGLQFADPGVPATGR